MLKSVLLKSKLKSKLKPVLKIELTTLLGGTLLVFFRTINDFLRGFLEDLVIDGRPATQSLCFVSTHLRECTIDWGRTVSPEQTLSETAEPVNLIISVCDNIKTHAV